MLLEQHTAERSERLVDPLPVQSRPMRQCRRSRSGEHDQPGRAEVTEGPLYRVSFKTDVPAFRVLDDGGSLGSREEGRPALDFTLNSDAAEAGDTLALLSRHETLAAEPRRTWDTNSDARASMLAVMNVPKDAPAWLVELVSPHWGAPEWNAWEDYREQLAALGVDPNMLKPIGSLSRPTDISGHIPSLEPWISVPIDWQRFGDRDAPLHALGDLVTEIAKTTT